MSKAITYVFAAVLFALPALASDCESLYRAGTDAAPIAAKKTEFAMTAINDPGFLAREKRCVEAAIYYLGVTHVTSAIPRLIELLDYEIGNSMFTPSPAKRYPAMGALSNMGEPAIPALLELIAESENSETRNKNAVGALISMSAYRSHPAAAISRLDQAANAESSPARASRLRQAARQIRATVCVAQPCNESE